MAVRELEIGLVIVIDSPLIRKLKAERRLLQRRLFLGRETPCSFLKRKMRGMKKIDRLLRLARRGLI